MNYKPSKTTPSLSYALDVFSEAVRYDLNCHRVGRIVAFDSTEKTCDVELIELKPNKGKIQQYPLIKGLPLMISGGIDTYITFGDIVGTECLIHFNDRDIDSWFLTGESYQPHSGRTHNFSDGFVSLRPYSVNQVFDYELDGTVIKKGNSKIKLKQDSIEVTNGNCNLLISENNVTITGNIIVNGNIQATGIIKSDSDILSGEKSVANHTHLDSSGKPTSKPV